MNEYASLNGLYNAGKLAYNKAFDYKLMDAYEKLGPLKHFADDYLHTSIIKLFSQIADKFNVTNKKEYFKRLNLNELLKTHLKKFSSLQLVDESLELLRKLRDTYEPDNSKSSFSDGVIFLKETIKNKWESVPGLLKGISNTLSLKLTGSRINDIVNDILSSLNNLLSLPLELSR